jgi:hypothetical protein
MFFTNYLFFCLKNKARLLPHRLVSILMKDMSRIQITKTKNRVLH